MNPPRLLPLAILASLLCACHRRAPVIDEHKPGDVSIIAFGDWGSPSGDRQTVADTLSKYVANGHSVDAGLLLGDNFLVRLKDTEDPQIQKLFEKTYDRKTLNFPFYAAYGNHDYAGNNAAIELNYPIQHPNSRWHMPARWYRVDLPASGQPLVTILVLDSNQQTMKPPVWQAQIDWMNAELSKPRGQWTICCAHHTMFSNGAHGDNGVLQKSWGPIFKSQHVDFYLCGHDHTLQHLEIPGWPVTFLVSGGGAAGRRPMLRDNRGPFSRSQIGFTYFHFTPTCVTVRLIDGHGPLLHEFTRDPAGAVHVAVNTPSDKATLHQLKTILGFDVGEHPTPQPTTEPTTQSSGHTDVLNPQNTLKALQGTWKIVSSNRDGIKDEGFVFQDWIGKTITVSDDQVLTPDGPKTLALGEATDPRPIDLVAPNNQKAWSRVGLFHIEGERLILSVDFPQGPRPKAFNKVADTTEVVTLVRVDQSRSHPYRRLRETSGYPVNLHPAISCGFRK